MTRPMKIDGYLIVQLEDRLTPTAAFGELLDNSFDAGATNIEIIFTRRMMSITDNGEGTDDPNLIATPSMSASRHKKSAIGSKAAGAKEALATFGRAWDIQTVPRGLNRYHHYKILWDEDGPLPPQYEGKGKPAYTAPKEIRNGGTKITVTERRDGFPTLRFDYITRVLEETYRPSLHGGTVKIILRNRETGYVTELKNVAYDRKLFTEAVKEIEGGVNSRQFLIRYGALKEHNRALSGCHLIFGPRVIKTLNSIGRHALPSACYVDVILSDGWKRLLSTNKSNIARYEDELIAELETQLGAWITLQKEQAQQYKLQIISGVVADMLNESLAFLNQSKEGNRQPKPREPRPIIEEEDDDEIITLPREKRRKHKKRRRAIHGGQLAPERDQRQSSTIIQIVADPALGDNLFGVSFTTDGVATIKLNTGPKQREVAEYYRLGKSDELFKIAAMAFAVNVAENRNKYAAIFEGLRANDCQIHEEAPSSEIVNMISNFLLNANYGKRGSIKRVAA